MPRLGVKGRQQLPCCGAEKNSLMQLEVMQELYGKGLQGGCCLWSEQCIAHRDFGCAGTAEGLSGEKKGQLPMPWSCTDSSLLHLIRTRDPSGKGLHSVQALRLLMLLLHWNPAMRPTPEQVCSAAAAHPRRSLQAEQLSYLHQRSSGTQRPRRPSLPHIASAFPPLEAAVDLQHAPQ